MTTLYHLAVSPWSERARWALDACGIEHEQKEHLPFVGEIILRRRAGTKKASVPLLLTDEGTVQGSWAIARWADEHGRPGLFPDGKLADIERWNDVSERMLNAARARMFPRLLQNDDALYANVPRPLRFLGPVALVSAREGVRFLGRKYREEHEGAGEAVLREGLVELRAALGGRPTLLEGFSYADVTMATAVNGIAPPSDRFLPLSAGTREVWTDRALADEFADLVAWRDALYEAHRARG